MVEIKTDKLYNPEELEELGLSHVGSLSGHEIYKSGSERFTFERVGGSLKFHMRYKIGKDDSVSPEINYI